MIYLDNAAGSWPKPPAVQEAICNYLAGAGGNPGRGLYSGSLEAGQKIWQARTQVAKFFRTKEVNSWVFTSNTTHALNIAIKGVLKPGDHAITTSMEHNSVLRPLRKLAANGIELAIVVADKTGCVDPAQIKREVKRNTRLVVISHASNVTGAIMPLREVAAITSEHNLLLLVDAAQTAGVLPVYPEEMGADLLVAAAHKSLYGPAGGGLLYIRPGLMLETLIEGGTGKDSDLEGQPATGPERYEAGTPNLLGIVGLSAGIDLVEKTGLEKIRSHDQALTAAFMEGMVAVPRAISYGPLSTKERLGVISINIQSMAPDQVGFMLDRYYGIAVRTGLHCAPLAHKTIGTFPSGTVRFSFSYHNNLDQIEMAVKALAAISREH